MKYKFLLVLVFSFFTSSLFAQKGIGAIYFKGGSVLNGIIRIKKDAKVIYKADKKAKKTTFNFKDLKQIKIDNSGVSEYYVYLKVKGRPYFKILQEITIGRVSLYNNIVEGYSAGVPIAGFGAVTVGIGYHYSIDNYYVKKENENEVTYLGSAQWGTTNFKKAASKYFKDCPELVEKIQNKTYKRKNIREIIDFYNTQCR